MAQGIFIQEYTGAAGINIAHAPTFLWTLIEVRLHLDIVGGAVEDLTITNDSGVAPAIYDTLILTQAMAAVTDIIWTPPGGPMHFRRDDVLDIVYANSNTRTWGIEIIYSTRE